MFLSVTHKTRGTLVARQVQIAHRFQDRLIGLLRTPILASDEGLWLSPCTSVHTFFMRYAIDVLFIDDQYKILSILTLSPWRVSRWVPKARGVLELAAGSAARAGLQAGDALLFEEHR